MSNYFPKKSNKLDIFNDFFKYDQGNFLLVFDLLQVQNAFSNKINAYEFI